MTLFGDLNYVLFSSLLNTENKEYAIISNESSYLPSASQEVVFKFYSKTWQAC